MNQMITSKWIDEQIAADNREFLRDHDWKQAVTNDFLSGDSIATIANRCVCNKLRVEQVLREAVTGLSAVVVRERRRSDEADARCTAAIADVRHRLRCELWIRAAIQRACAAVRAPFRAPSLTTKDQA